MKLIASLTSPFARKVRIVLAEKRIDYDLMVDIPWNAGTQVPDFNPLGKVPVLVMDDNTSLYDSRVIVEYLDNATPIGHLIPQEPRQRIVVRRWEALADGISDAAGAVFVERKRAPDKQDDDWVTRQMGKVLRGLESMAADLGDKPWCWDDTFSLADIAAGCTLGYLDFRFPELGWRESHPNLAILATKLERRPSFQSSVPVA